MSNQSPLANQLAYAHGQGGWDAVAKVVEGMVADWRLLPTDGDTSKAPFDGRPVLIAINTSWGNQVHRVVWTDAVHESGIFGWAVEDRKFGPYPLRGYTTVAAWQPLPEPPANREEIANG